MLGNEKALWLLFLVPVVLIPLYIYRFYRSKKMLAIFSVEPLCAKLNNQVSVKKQIFKAILLILAFIFVVIALSQPAWNPKPASVKRKGRDVAILLDVSRSMLAEDIKPSRLERAKLAIKDLLEVLDGDRIAIVTFAGSATVKCPLTNDYGFVRMILDRDITVESTPVGGTNLGDAIRKTLRDVFDNSTDRYADLIIISDGEENTQSFPAQAAADAAEKGIRIIAIGLGSQNTGARIPVYENDRKTFLKYQGMELWTKLDPSTLAKVAAASENGKFLTVSPNQTFDLDELYRDLIETADKKQFDSAKTIEYQQKFQIFIASAIVLLILEVFVSEKRKI